MDRSCPRTCGSSPRLGCRNIRRAGIGKACTTRIWLDARRGGVTYVRHPPEPSYTSTPPRPERNPPEPVRSQLRKVQRLTSAAPPRQTESRASSSATWSPQTKQLRTDIEIPLLVMVNSTRRGSIPCDEQSAKGAEAGPVRPRAAGSRDACSPPRCLATAPQAGHPRAHTGPLPSCIGLPCAAGKDLITGRVAPAWAVTRHTRRSVRWVWCPATAGDCDPRPCSSIPVSV